MKTIMTGTPKNSPLVSVVVPVFDGAAFLAEALDSVLAQSWAPLELIVVDDGSTDESGRIAHAYRSAHERCSVLRQENQGVTSARNQGIAASAGEFVAFLDQDDLWTETALETHLRHHRAEPDLQFTLAMQECFLQPGCAVPPWFRLQRLDEPVTGYLPGTLVARRSAFDRVGLFDEHYPICSDADWFARARDAGVPMATLPDVTLRRRIHDANQSRRSAQIQSELLRIMAHSARRKRTAGSP